MSDEVQGTETQAQDTAVETSPSFLDGVDSQFASDPNIAKFDNVNDLAREHVNLQSLLGRKGLVVPKEGDSQEIWDKYRTEMNIPSDTSGYFGDTTPEDTDLPSHIDKVAHNSNLSVDQYNEIMQGYESWYKNVIDNNSQEIEQTTNENLNSLKKEWGRAYEAKTDMGASALSTLTKGKAESVANIELSDGTSLGNNPNFIKVMASIGEILQEKGLLEGTNVNPSAMSPDEAQSKLSQLMADPEKSAILFSQEFHPSKEELVKERQRLLSFAYPQD